MTHEVHEMRTSLPPSVSLAPPILCLDPLSVAPSPHTDSLSFTSATGNQDTSKGLFTGTELDSVSPSRNSDLFSAFRLHRGRALVGTSAKMASLCFSTSDPAAVNATKLYDFNNDDANLWVRQSQLPPCSSSLSPPEFLCLVCLQITVYAVCTNLTNAVKVVMEGVGVPINIVRGDCPKLVSEDSHAGRLSAAIIIIIIIILIIVGVVWHRCHQQQRDSELQKNDQTEPLKQVQVENGGDHVVQADQRL
ncbi:hypothetical protein Q8A73_009358 [Channa argus]|nr:hypothetical protein Q8A73_009358 [Channa argus]